MKIQTVAMAFITVTAFAQSKISLLNRDTGEPIRYANIWVENNVVATSDSLGTFYLPKRDASARYKISAIGYQALDTVEISESQTVLMSNDVIALDNVALSTAKNKRRTKIGKLKNADVFIASSQETLVPMIGKYFPNDGQKLLFIDKVKFKAHASAKNRIVGITLYSVTEDGKPDEPINNQNIVCRIRKGHHINEADLRKLDIPFPKNGIVVIINYLQLEQNRQYRPNSDSSFFYEPIFDAANNAQAPDYWYFGKQGWTSLKEWSLSMQLIVTD